MNEKKKKLYYNQNIKCIIKRNIIQYTDYKKFKLHLQDQSGFFIVNFFFVILVKVKNSFQNHVCHWYSLFLSFFWSFLIVC